MMLTAMPHCFLSPSVVIEQINVILIPGALCLLFKKFFSGNFMVLCVKCYENLWHILIGDFFVVSLLVPQRQTLSCPASLEMLFFNILDNFLSSNFSSFWNPASWLLAILNWSLMFRIFFSPTVYLLKIFFVDFLLFSSNLSINS